MYIFPSIFSVDLYQFKSEFSFILTAKYCLQLSSIVNHDYVSWILHLYIFPGVHNHLVSWFALLPINHFSLRSSIELCVSSQFGKVNKYSTHALFFPSFWDIPPEPVGLASKSHAQLSPWSSSFPLFWSSLFTSPVISSPFLGTHILLSVGLTFVCWRLSSGKFLRKGAEEVIVLFLNVCPHTY